MCVYITSEIKILKKDTYYYKVVRGSKHNNYYMSLIQHEYRVPQSPNPDVINELQNNVGDTFYYKIGEEITSDFDNTPGIYCYCRRMKANAIKNSWVSNYFIKVLKVLVKKGSKIRYAKTSLDKKSNDVVLIETLTPVEVIA